MKNTQKFRYKTVLQSKRNGNIITVLETLRKKKNTVNLLPHFLNTTPCCKNSTFS